MGLHDLHLTFVDHQDEGQQITKMVRFETFEIRSHHSWSALLFLCGIAFCYASTVSFHSTGTLELWLRENNDLRSRLLSLRNKVDEDQEVRIEQVIQALDAQEETIQLLMQHARDRNGLIGLSHQLKGKQLEIEHLDHSLNGSHYRLVTIHKEIERLAADGVLSNIRNYESEVIRRFLNLSVT